MSSTENSEATYLTQKLILKQKMCWVNTINNPKAYQYTTIKIVRHILKILCSSKKKKKSVLSGGGPWIRQCFCQKGYPFRGTARMRTPRPPSVLPGEVACLSLTGGASRLKNNVVCFRDTFCLFQPSKAMESLIGFSQPHFLSPAQC